MTLNNSAVFAIMGLMRPSLHVLFEGFFWFSLAQVMASFLFL